MAAIGYRIILHLATAIAWVVASGNQHLPTTFATRAVAVCAHTSHTANTEHILADQSSGTSAAAPATVTCARKPVLYRILHSAHHLLSADAELLNYPTLLRRIRDAPYQEIRDTVKRGILQYHLLQTITPKTQYNLYFSPIVYEP